MSDAKNQNNIRAETKVNREKVEKLREGPQQVICTTQLATPTVDAQTHPQN